LTQKVSRTEGLLLVTLATLRHTERLRLLHPNPTRGMVIIAISELTTRSITPPTDSTNLRVTMRHECGTALI